MRRAWSIVAATAIVASASAVAAVRLADAQEKVPPAVTFQPAAVDFGDQVAGRASRPVRITVTNSGDVDLYLNSVTLGGDDRADFVLSEDHCTGATIKPGKSCVVDLVIAPSATGPRRGVLTFNDNGGVQTVPLSGNGINSAEVPPR